MITCCDHGRVSTSVSFEGVSLSHLLPPPRNQSKAFQNMVFVMTDHDYMEHNVSPEQNPSPQDDSDTSRTTGRRISEEDSVDVIEGFDYVLCPSLYTKRICSISHFSLLVLIYGLEQYASSYISLLLGVLKGKSIKMPKR